MTGLVTLGGYSTTGAQLPVSIDYPAALALRQMLGLFGLPGMSFEIRLVLRREDVRTCVLGMGACLAEDAFLADKLPARERDDMHYDIRFDGSA